jgi:hypothetical protein
MYSEAGALFCFPGRGTQNMRYANQAVKQLSFIVKIFKSSQKESNSFLNSTILGLQGLTQELILQLFSMSSTSERGESWQGGDQVLSLSHLPSQHQSHA